MTLAMAAGFGNGYLFTTAARSEDEILQGGRAGYGLPMMQAGQIYAASNAISHLPLPAPLQMINSFAPVLGAVICPFFTAVKQDHYGVCAKIFNRFFPSLSLPATLSEKTVNISRFFAAHSGTLARGAMITATAALPIFGSPYVAAAMLVPVTYQVLDSGNMLPHKVSRVMEKIHAGIIQSLSPGSGQYRKSIFRLEPSWLHTRV